jgi:leucyl/phenylalanyl-tRNA--protein transferase
MEQSPALPWLAPGEPFPPPETAWDAHSPAPGLLASGGALDVATLGRAYRQGIFPWFSQGQPLLWWSPDPRMVLRVDDFLLHHALRKTLRAFARNPQCSVRFDSQFAQVITACATTPRAGQRGTWIVPAMREAYCALHAAGLTHSVETWMDGQLVGGLYCVTIGRAVFGESMFTQHRDASKIALAALVAFCRACGMPFIDCQQNTPHLASLGAREMPRKEFLREVNQQIDLPAPNWQFDASMWATLPL